MVWLHDLEALVCLGVEHLGHVTKLDASTCQEDFDVDGFRQTSGF